MRGCLVIRRPPLAVRRKEFNVIRVVNVIVGIENRLQFYFGRDLCFRSVSEVVLVVSTQHYLDRIKDNNFANTEKVVK